MKFLKFYLMLLFSLALTLAGHGQIVEQSLYQGKIAPNGAWFSYTKSNNGFDTLYIENATANLSHRFPGANNESFSPESKWMACSKSDSLYIFDLVKARCQKIPSVSSYQFLSNENILMQGNTKIFIQNLKTGKLYVFEDCLSYYLNSKKTKIAIIGGKQANEVFLLDITSGVPTKTLPISVTNKASGLVWSQSGLAYAFFEKQSSGYAVHYYNLINKQHEVFLNTKFTDLSRNFNIPGNNLYVSEDGDKVFFDKIQVDEQNMSNPGPLIWTSTMKKLPLSPISKSVPLMQMWLPQQNKSMPVETPEYPLSMLTAKEKYALVTNHSGNDPSKVHESDKIDLSLLDLNSGNKKLMVKDAIFEKNQIVISRQEMAWFKDKNWYSYDFEAEREFCLTCGIPTPFYDANNDRPGIAKSFGIAGWFSKQSQAIIYDEFDIWLLAKGDIPKRITYGREKNTVYRVRNSTNNWGPKGKLNGISGAVYEEDELVLEVTDQNIKYEGIALWNPKDGLRQWPTSFHDIYGIQKAAQNDRVMYVRSSYNDPPQIVMGTGKPQKIIMASGKLEKPQKVEIISYKGLRDESLKGALFYPIDYDPSIKYPTIVFIYERFSYMAHEYLPNTSFGVIGFNPAIYARNGYFVLCPDINYEVNQSAKSGLYCVNQAIKKADSMASIDLQRLGLIGHSFGGYETAAILTQTDRFKVAVSGAGIMDLTSSYLSITNNGRERRKNFENGQHRLTLPFYEKGFQENSPVLKAHKINTPLLLWAGDRDGVVDPNQSISMFLALRRLGRPAAIVSYSNEDHVLSNPLNQEDLGLKILQWFGHYLKGTSAESWMECK